MLRIFGRAVLAVVGMLLMAVASWAAYDVDVVCTGVGPLQWDYRVDNLGGPTDEACTDWWLYTPCNITGIGAPTNWTGISAFGGVYWYADGPAYYIPPGSSLTGFWVTSDCPNSAPSGWDSYGDGGGFDSGTVPDAPLPVELESFTAVAGNGTITLRWTTASELNNLGFHLYRALDRRGPYERITAERIAGAGTSTMPRTYTFTDMRLTNGLTYYYRIEDVSSDGIRELHRPVAAKPMPPVVRSSWGAIKVLLK